MVLNKIWDLLDIKPTDDVRAIKRAYSSQLKSTKPEDDPEGFQRLHFAYKQALHSAKEEVAHSAPLESLQDSIDERVEDTVGAANQEQSSDQSTNDQSNVGASEEKSHYQIEGERLVLACEELIADTSRSLNVEEWSFLLESPFILDPTFNQQLGEIVFYMIGKNNAELNSEGNNTKKIDADIINYLDEIFNWSALRFYIEGRLDAEIVSEVMPLLDEGENDNSAEKLLSSVRGGEVINRSKRKISLTPENRRALAEAEEAQDGVKQFILYLMLVMLVLCAVAASEIFSPPIKIQSVFILIGVLCLIVAFVYGVFKRKKVALFVLWPIAIMMLVSFPIGTIWGILLIGKLNKAGQLYS